MRTSAASAARAISIVSAGSAPSGFSPQKCLPAAAAASAISRWRKFGAQIETASTSGSSITARQSVVERAYPSRSAAPRARSSTSSAATTSLARASQSG